MNPPQHTPHDKRTHGLLARAAWGVLGWVLCCTSADAAERRWHRLDEVRSILEEAVEIDPRDRLANLGPSAAPAVWATLSGQALSSEDGLVVGPYRPALLESIEHWPPARTVEHLLDAVHGETTLSERVVLVDLLARADTGEALAGLFEAFDGVDGTQLRSGRVKSSMQSAIQRLLNGHPHRLDLLAELAPDIPDELAPVVVRSVGQLSLPGVVRVLEQMLAAHPTIRVEVLRELGQGRRMSPLTRSRGAELARRYLDDADHLCRRLATAALGNLGDARSFDALILRLDDGDPVVARLASDALTRLSKLNRQWSSSQWRAWYDAELAWLESAAPLAQRLELGKEHEAVSSLSELAQHHLFTEEIVDILDHGLLHASAAVRSKTILTLARIQHPATVEPLIHAMKDVDDALHGQAHAALRALTRIDLGESWIDWSSWWAELN